jgi:hypothetical protein
VLADEDDAKAEKAIILTGRHYAAARAALERYDYEQAATHLKNYLSLRPSDPAVLLMAAQTDRRRGKLDEAFRTLRLAEKHGATAESVEGELKLLAIQGGKPDGVEKLLRFCDDTPTGRRPRFAWRRSSKGPFASATRSWRLAASAFGSSTAPPPSIRLRGSTGAAE